MDSTPIILAHDFPPFFRIHSTGRVERYHRHDFVSPSHDPLTGVASKDVSISAENGASARIYLPTADPGRKLPLLVYIHGGAFCIESAFSSFYHRYLNALASRSRSVVVSVEYRLAPEHPIPACYEDAHAVVEWVGSHSGSEPGPNPWLNDRADFSRAYVAGDSAGANIAHDMVVRSSVSGPGIGLRFSGLILIHPYFGAGKPEKLWDFLCPDSKGAGDVRLNPAADPDQLARLGCDRVLVCVAEKDLLRNRGLIYCEGLRKSGFRGPVELFESVGEGHVFHLLDPVCDGSGVLMDRVVGFISGSSVRAHF
ncbi:Probable carboxylesterase 2 [Striga hermonthica]|uniref:Probable carboxylesterase 2 n=1 Tax=Striga hermonthica TaxID=68872 RepID=A0A9N7R113_STRHE|nr:Probable carboxylesterase 2 [Striga hermonthica]